MMNDELYEEVFSRTMKALSFMTEHEAATYFHDEGYDDEMVFLAIKAAKILVSDF